MLDDKITNWVKLHTNSIEYHSLVSDASSRQYWRVGNYILGHDPKTKSFNDFIEIGSFLKQNQISVPEIISTHKDQYYIGGVGKKLITQLFYCKRYGPKTN